MPMSKRRTASPTRSCASPPPSSLSLPRRRSSAAACAFFEPRFGNDSGEVRIHTDGRAAASAAAVNADAYTVGQHILFGAGQYLSLNSSARWLVAHELVHVMQQGAVGH
jgi:hypothetical protein